MPAPVLVLIPLFRWKPVVVHASILVAGVLIWAVLKMSMAEKSVCVSSVEVGPRSRWVGAYTFLDVWEERVRGGAVRRRVVERGREVDGEVCVGL